MSRILHMTDAAEFCGVTEATIREWIDLGMRSFALGHATHYEPRDFLIREEWLLAFLDSQSTVRPKRTADAKPEKPMAPKKSAAQYTGRRVGLRCPV